MPQTHYRANLILPVDGAPIENGVLTVEDTRISGLRPSRDIPDEFAHEIDLGDVILVPGFVNAHTHLELTCYRNRVAAGSLWEWIGRLIALRREPGAAAAERDAVRDGAMQSLAAGVTCVGDISRAGIHAAVLRDSPIRKTCFVELISGAADPPRTADELRQAVRDAAESEQPDALRIGVSPHSPFTVTAADLRATAALALDERRPLTMHLLETADEARWLTHGGGPVAQFLKRMGHANTDVIPPGDIPRWLDATGLLLGEPLFAHVNFADDATIAALARSRPSVVWCPRAHAFFGHPPHPWREMARAGINVCLGTDGLACNSTLSILDELRFLWREYPDGPVDGLLRMATLNGASALGMAHQIGSLTPGKLADFVAIPCPPNDSASPVESLLSGDVAPSGVWIGGRRVFPASSP